MATVASLAIEVQTDGVRRAQGDIDRLGRTGTQNSERLSRSFAGLGNVIAAIGIGKLAANASELGKIFGQVRTLVDEAVFPIDEMQDSIRELSDEFGIAQLAVTQGMYDVVSAGAENLQVAEEQIEAAAKLAKGGNALFATALDGLTSANNAYRQSNLEAIQISDIFFATVAKGKLNMEELSASMSTIAPIASSMGVRLDEVGGALATITATGTPAGQAANQLKAALEGILKPTTEAAKYAKSLGIEFSQTALESKGLEGFLQDVIKRSGGSSEALSKLFTSSEALSAILGLTGNNAERFAGNLDAVENSAGETEKALAIMQETFSYQFDRMVTQINNLVNTVFPPLLKILSVAIPKAIETFTNAFTVDVNTATGEVERMGIGLRALQPILRTVTGLYEKLVIPVVEFFRAIDISKGTFLGDMFEKIRNTVGPTLPFLGELAAVLATVIASQAGLALIVGVLSGIAGAITAIGVALIANPIGLAIAGIVTTSILLYDNWETIVDFFETTVAQALATFINNIIDVGKNVEKFVDEALADLMGLPGEIVEIFKSIDLFEVAKDVLAGFTNGLKAGITGVTDAAKDVAGSVVSGIKGFLKIQSPSKETEQLGIWTSMGLAAGITKGGDHVKKASENTAKVITDELESTKQAFEEFGDELEKVAKTQVADAYEGMSDSARDFADRTIESLEDYSKRLELSGDDLRAYELAQEGVNQETAEAIIAMEKAIEKQEELNRQQEYAERIVGGYENQIAILTAELEEGADAAERMKLETEGFTDAQADAIIEARQLKDELQKQKTEIEEFNRAVGRFADEVGRVFMNATDIDDLLDTARDKALGWLKNLGEEFIANEIKVLFGEEGLDSLIASIKGAFSGLADSLGNIFSSIKNALTGEGGVLDGIKNIFSGAGGPSAVGADGFVVNPPPVGENSGEMIEQKIGAAASGYQIGTMFTQIGEEFEEGRTEIMASIGSVIGSAFGPLGAALGAAAGSVVSGLFGESSARTVGQGMFVTVGPDGDAFGQSFEKKEKKRSLYRGTRKWTEFEELEQAELKPFNDAVEMASESVINSFAMLNEDVAGALENGFSISQTRFEGTEEELNKQFAEWTNKAVLTAFETGLEDVSATTYRRIRHELGDIRDAVSGEFALTVEEVEKGMLDIHHKFNILQPGLEAMGVTFDTFSNNLQAQTAFTDNIMNQLVETMGGTDAAMEQFNVVQSRIMPTSVQAGIAMSQLDTQLADFDEHMIGVNGSTIRTTEELYAFISAQNINTEEGRKNIAVAFEHAETLANASEVYKYQKQVLDNVAEATNLLNLQFDASHPLAQELAGQLADTFGGMENLTSSLGSYYDQFFSDEEKADMVRAQNTASVAAFNEQLGLSGAAAIDTKEEFRNYVESLDLTTEAGQKAFQAAMEVSNSMAALSDTGQSLDENLSAIPESMTQMYEGVKLQTNNTLAEIAKTSEAYSAEAMAKNKASVEAEQYVQSLNLSTAAGRGAYLQVLKQIKANGDVNNVTDLMLDKLKEVPESMRAGWTRVSNGMLGLTIDQERLIEVSNTTAKEVVNSADKTINKSGTMARSVTQDTEKNIKSFQEVTKKSKETLAVVKDSAFGINKEEIRAAGVKIAQAKVITTNIERQSEKVTAIMKNSTKVVEASADVFDKAFDVFGVSTGGFADMAERSAAKINRIRLETGEEQNNTTRAILDEIKQQRNEANGLLQQVTNNLLKTLDENRKSNETLGRIREENDRNARRDQANQ